MIVSTLPKLLRLRAGADLPGTGNFLADLLACIIIEYLLNLKLPGAEGFRGAPLPHMDPFGWYMGKYGKRGIDPRPGPSSFKVCSRFDQETADTLKRFMSDVVDDSNNFVMS